MFISRATGTGGTLRLLRSEFEGKADSVELSRDILETFQTGAFSDSVVTGSSMKLRPVRRIFSVSPPLPNTAVSPNHEKRWFPYT